MMGKPQFRNKNRHSKADAPHQRYADNVFEIQALWKSG